MVGPKTNHHADWPEAPASGRGEMRRCSSEKTESAPVAVRLILIPLSGPCGPPPPRGGRASPWCPAGEGSERVAIFQIGGGIDRRLHVAERLRRPRPDRARALLRMEKLVLGQQPLA